MKGASLLKINFNKWFYEYHRYLKNSRDGHTDFNDTKWNNMNDKLSRLIDIESNMLSEQPFGVVSNKYGFDKLIELFEKSNYTFDDLDDALVDTYKMSYENAMSRMLVNTHTIISYCKSTDKKVVSTDPKDYRYYIIDVPFNQLHFGDRDEIIRQYLNKLYNHRTEYYMPMEELISSDITKVLGCTFLCVVNGLICNNWGIAIDDKGFHFRVYWGSEYDAEFIIYKLDECIIDTFDFPINRIQSGVIPKSNFTNYTIYPEGVNCIVNFYIPIRESTLASVPNFGVFKEDGLHINGLQKKTLSNLNSVRNAKNNPYTSCKVIVYGLKYLFELPNTYPCINFMDMLYSHPIVTENEDDVYTFDEKKVVGMVYDSNNTMPSTTPPISIDRSASESFKNVINCLKMSDYLMALEPTMHKIGNNINSFSGDSYYFNQDILTPASNMLIDLKNLYKMYVTGGIITSLITFTHQRLFQDLINRLERFVNEVTQNPTKNTAIKYSIDEFYGYEYHNLVERITRVFNHPSLQVFHDLDAAEFTRNYFEPENKNTRFNRPISEQCFIAMKYSYDQECWLFTYPDLKHFHGIGNTFYIEFNNRRNTTEKNSNGLYKKTTYDRNEVYKFFFVYTDTEDTMNKNVEEFDFSNVFDFDKFSEEVEAYQGYIRYWNVENHLRKLSHIMYSNDSTESQLQVLSKVLTGKLNGEELLDLYPTDMNYEPSNASTDNVSSYTEDSERAPFALNFLFYTIMLMYDNKDQVLSYFLWKLNKNKYSNRYTDIDISTVFDEYTKLKVNYSILNSGATTGEIHEITSDNPLFFCGIPNAVYGSVTNPYTYTFNVYDTSIKYPFIETDGSITDTIYIDNVDGYTSYDYTYDIRLVKKVFAVIGYIKDFVNFVETRFTYSFDICKQLLVYIKKLVFYKNDIDSFITDNQSKFILAASWLVNFQNMIDNSISMINELWNHIDSFRVSIDRMHKEDFYTFFNTKFLKVIHEMYSTYGFEDTANHKIKALYYHLTKINDKMNLFEFDKWIQNIDIECVKWLYDSISNNPTLTNKPYMYYDEIELFINGAPAFINSIKNAYDTFSSTYYTTNVVTILQACCSIINDANKELYAIDKISINNVSFTSQPRYVIATIQTVNITGNTETNNLILIPTWEKDGNNYNLIDIRQLCSYAFIYNNTTAITPSSIKVYDENGSEISPSTTLTCEITLLRVGNMMDVANDIYELSDIENMEFPFKNIHEISERIGNMSVSEQHANLNFELLAGNRFIPLTTTSEYVFDRNSLIAEPCDIIHTNGSFINKYGKLNYGYHKQTEIYVKPVQVLHPEIIAGVMKSIGQGYYPDHRIYVKTTDSNQFVFPIIVRATDHSKYQGFVEAIVDYNRSKWFKIEPTDWTSYIYGDVECEVIDDNVCNFLDEFNNDEYVNYQITPFVNNSEEDVYSLPGDPLYVQTNSDYVHTRLSWIFGEDIPNRFIDQDHKFYKYVYINSGAINEDDSMRIFMINHNFNTLTLPEMYPVLRDEPDDHTVHVKERETYTELLEQHQNKLEVLRRVLTTDEEAYHLATDPNHKFELKLKIEDDELKIKYEETFIRRLENYIIQPESKTTWYNLFAYDDAITYIDNGRATMTHIPRKRDLIYTDKIDVRMYDWEHKCWLNPNDFTITLTTIDGSTVDNHDAYKTDDVQHELMITPNDTTFSSKKVLVYFVYNTSDIYEDIVNDNTTFNVRFKPALSTYESNVYDIYDDIKLRKHYDTKEVYTIEETYDDPSFSLTNGLYVKRFRTSGKYTDASVCRWCDLKVDNHDYEDFDIYVKFPFKNINQDQYTKNTVYNVNINQPIDGYEEDETITLVCISQTFDGNVSELLFTATTDSNTLTIVDSSIHPIPNGTYICTVAKDPKYKACGGLITIVVETVNADNIIDTNHQWIKVQSPQYKMIPDEFILVPNGVSITLPVDITLHNVYVRDDNGSLTPKKYYYDTNYEVRYPISNITKNDFTSRFNIDTTQNPNVKKIKSNYLNVCRYSTQKIPTNGLMDFTGYIPTPLSRNRYEFWVNGRCLNDSNVTIISPTAIQLHDLTSLRNFELIELVDDIDNTNSVFPTGSVYVDLEGNTFSSYTLMMMSNKNIRYQSIQYRFYFNTKSDLDTYTKNFISNPNNQDIEPDILSYLVIDNTVTSYNQLFNIPSINGVPLYHPTTSDLGLLELPSKKITDVYDKTWVKEITTNRLFPMTHRDLLSSREYVHIHVFETSTGFRIVPIGVCDKFFTIYITSDSSDSIQNITGTKKIIPMIKVGTELFIENDFRGMWVHSTFSNTPPVQLK